MTRLSLRGVSGVLFAGFVSFAGAAATGCSPEPALCQVTGVASVNGRPLPVGYVVFYPADNAPLSGRMIPRGDITADGIYRMTTNGQDGVPLGKYKVVVISQPSTLPSGFTGKPNRMGFYNLVPHSYSRQDATPLYLDVTDRLPFSYDLALVSR